jgi:hypothetical protein
VTARGKRPTFRGKEGLKAGEQTLERSRGERADGCRGDGVAAAGSWGRVESARRDRAPASRGDAIASARARACAMALDRVRNRDAILSLPLSPKKQSRREKSGRRITGGRREREREKIVDVSRDGLAHSDFQPI